MHIVGHTAILCAFRRMILQRTSCWSLSASNAWWYIITGYIMDTFRRLYRCIKLLHGVIIRLYLASSGFMEVPLEFTQNTFMMLPSILLARNMTLHERLAAFEAHHEVVPESSKAALVVETGEGNAAECKYVSSNGRNSLNTAA